MSMRKTEVQIQGTSALLMHRFPLIPIEAIEKKTAKEQAEIAAYRIPKGVPKVGNLYLPGVCMRSALVAGAVFSKGKGRGSLQKPVAACVQISPEYIDLGTKQFSVDSRPVVIKATRGRIVRHRPRIDEWGCSFVIEWDDVLLKETEMRKIVDDTGLRVGLLDYRPACKGPFGRYMVTHWETN